MNEKLITILGVDDDIFYSSSEYTYDFMGIDDSDVTDG